MKTQLKRKQTVQEFYPELLCIATTIHEKVINEINAMDEIKTNCSLPKLCILDMVITELQKYWQA